MTYGGSGEGVGAAKVVFVRAGQIAAASRQREDEGGADCGSFKAAGRCTSVGHVNDDSGLGTAVDTATGQRNAALVLFILKGGRSWSE